jgi:restriction endonuclease S subunit
VNHVTAHICDSLSNVAAISAGYPLRGAVDELDGGEVAIVQMRNVDADSGVNWSEVQRVGLPSKRPPAFLAAGDIIFTTRGARNFALALDSVAGEAVCSPHFFVIRVIDAHRIEPKFLAWQINQRAAQEYFQREATGSHILNIRREVIEALPVAIPPVETQHLIVALADAARAERAALTRLIDNRNQQLEAIALGLSTLERHHA